jgi:hypothetical protein
VGFPVTIAGRQLASPAALAQLVRTDAAAGGSTVVPGCGPSTWLLGVDGLSRRELVGLAAALVALPEAASIAEGARLAVAVGDSALGPLLLQAVASHDVGLLLAPDPPGGGAVEDALLQAAAAVADLRDRDRRDALLTQLRQAGRTDLELLILLAHGSAEELAHWLPAVLVEGGAIEPDQLAQLTALAAGDDARALAIRASLTGAGLR